MCAISAGDLSAVLWQQRTQLEKLLFRLETQELYARSGSVDWLRLTAADIEASVERVRLELLACHVESASLASSWGAPPHAALPVLAVFAPPGAWPALMADHLADLQRLFDLIQAAVARNLLALDAIPPSPTDAGSTGSGEGDADAGLAALLGGDARARARAAAASAVLPLVAGYLGRD